MMTKIKKQSWIILSLILLILSNSCQESNETQKGLKDVSSFPIGTAINFNILENDPALLKLVKDNFNSITATGDMKMNKVLPKEGPYHWSRIDSILDFAENNNQRLFGHNLIWHSSTPKWVADKALNDSLWLENFMKDYIHTYVGRYKGKVKGWDVVNEGLETKGGEFRKTIWYNALGEDYIAKAFVYAHQADPDAILFYNDFNLERDTAKLNGTLNMVERLISKGVPISGIGFQMHIRMDIPDEIIENSLKKAAATGLQIHLSEVDLIFNEHDDSKGGGIQKYTALTEKMKAEQGEKYKNLAIIYNRAVPKAQQYGITFWDFTDRDTWIKDFFNLDDWPCLYDDELQPKPAYYGFMNGLLDVEKNEH